MYTEERDMVREGLTSPGCRAQSLLGVVAQQVLHNILGNVRDLLLVWL